MVDDAAPNEGDTINFTVTASNLGPDAATGVAISDLLPAGLTYVSSSVTTGSYNDGTGECCSAEDPRLGRTPQVASQARVMSTTAIEKTCRPHTSLVHPTVKDVATRQRRQSSSPRRRPLTRPPRPDGAF